jgi:hypothetical protein
MADQQSLQTESVCREGQTRGECDQPTTIQHAQARDKGKQSTRRDQCDGGATALAKGPIQGTKICAGMNCVCWGLANAGRPAPQDGVYH